MPWLLVFCLISAEISSAKDGKCHVAVLEQMHFIEGGGKGRLGI